MSVVDFELDYKLEAVYERTEEISDYLGSRFTIDWTLEASYPNDQLRPLLDKSRPENLRVVGDRLDILLALSDEDFNQYVAVKLYLNVDERSDLGKSYREWFLDLRGAIVDRLAGGAGVMPELHPVPRTRRRQTPAT